MDWNEPTNSDPAHPNVLADLASKDTYAVTMGQVDAGFTNTPVGTMNWDHGSKFFRRKDGGAFLPVQISLAGGGTGATDAAGARVSLNISEKGTGNDQSRTNSQNNMVFCALSRQIKTEAPLEGGGTLEGDLTLSIQDGTTAQKGSVQLNNTLTSTSTTQALTAAQGKVLGDSIAAIPPPGTDVGFYQELVLNGSAGGWGGGQCMVVRVGRVVTISGEFTHSSTGGINSSVNFLPSWAEAAQDTFNTYYNNGEAQWLRVGVISSRRLSVIYSSGTRTNTEGFTISYIAA